ncbi:MAG: glycosyltransferase family 4 protein, partial [Gemmatimonadota bacterium]|nr:glycosyltransferase family 4 protein [Gemmatimonadota bacterium]
ASGWKGCEAHAELDGIEVHRAGARYTFSLAAPRYFRRRLRKRHFDVVVEDLNKVPLFTRYWTHAPVVALVHHLFGLTAFKEAWFPLAAATWLLERPIPFVFRSAPTIAVSASTREDLGRRGLDGERIEVIPNGIDLALYTPGPASMRTSEPSLLFLGRVKKYKRVDLLMRAVALLESEGLSVTLRVAGSGDDRPRLERIARKLGLSDRVHFLGFVDEARKLELFRTSWLHALTSPKEGWGISIMEASACGTPSIASDAPGLRESVVDGETGLLVPHGDVRALADSIASLLKDERRRESMGRQARSFAEGFSWDESADRVEAFLHRVVAGSALG